MVFHLLGKRVGKTPYRMPGCVLVPVILGLLLLIAACTGERRGALTFAVGGTPSELAFWERLVERFQARTGIEVDLLRQPSGTDQRRQGLVISLASRKSDPDVFFMDIVWIAQFAASGWLDPLDGMVQKDGLDLDAFFPGMIERVDVYRGRPVALPVFVDGGVLYYREDLLESRGLSSPQTWDQLLRLALDIQGEERKSNPGFYGFVWQGAQYEGLVCNFLEVAGSKGGGIDFRNGKIVLDTPQNREAAAFLHDLPHRYGVSPPSVYTEMKEEQARLMFQQGNALFERNWPYAWLLHEGPGSEVKGKTGIAILPRFPSGRNVSALGGWHVGISAFSDAKPLARELVKFLVSYEIQKEIALGLGLCPGLEDLYEDPDVVSVFPHFPRLREVFRHALPRPSVPYYALLSEAIQRHINAALTGAATPEEALARAERDARAIAGRYEERSGSP